MRCFLIILLGLLMSACGTPTASSTPTTTGDLVPAVVVAPTIATEQVTPSVVVTSTPTPEPAAILLPAPLYGLALDAKGIQQIWRLERDTQTFKQITQEQHDIWHYDISPIDGTLAFVSNNNLVRMRPDGSERQVLFTGPPVNQANPDILRSEIGWPHWSPDGQLIAFQQGGVVLIDATGGDISRIAAHEFNAVTDATSLASIEQMRTIIGWAPDSKRLAILETLYDGQELPHDQNIMIIDTAGAPLLRISTAGTVLWTPDGSALLRMAEYGKLMPSGIWKIDAATGEEQAVLDDPKLSIRDPYLLPDGSLLGFVFRGELITDPNQIVKTRLTAIKPDGSVEQLNQNPYKIQGGLWFPDGSAFLNVDYAGTQSQIRLIYAADRPAAELVFPKTIGVLRNLKWGQ